MRPSRSYSASSTLRTPKTARQLAAPAARKLTWTQVAAWRVRRQHLMQRAPAGNLLQVASSLCGLHAQVMSSAELTVWARVEDLDPQAVQRALWEDRTLIKTWAMRGTLHLLPAGELPLWRAALGVNRRYYRATWEKYFGITLEQLGQFTEVAAAALMDRMMTREELFQEVQRLTGSAAFGTKRAVDSWGVMLKPAAFAGKLCFAPSLGQRVRFTHPDTWLSVNASESIDPRIAAATIARRFLASYGPSTLHDLARWWGGSGGVSAARQWIAALGEEVAPVKIKGVRAWMLAADLTELSEFEPVRSVRLLPGFDQYVIAASHHARDLLPGDLRHRVFRPQGWVSPVLLVNGRMEGVWRHEIKGSRVEVAIEPFGKTPLWVRRTAAQEAERLAKFLGRTLTLTWNS